MLLALDLARTLGRAPPLALALDPDLTPPFPTNLGFRRRGCFQVGCDGTDNFRQLDICVHFGLVDSFLL